MPLKPRRHYSHQSQLLSHLSEPAQNLLNGRHTVQRQLRKDQLVVDVDFESAGLAEHLLEGVGQEVGADEVHPSVLLDSLVQRVPGDSGDIVPKQHQPDEPVLKVRDQLR